MSVLYKNFATNENTEVKGFWYTVDTNDDGTEVKFLIARKGKRNRRYGELLTKLLGPYQKQIELDTISPKLLQKLFLEAFLGGILRGWQNVYDENGDALAFNTENARKLMTDLPDLYDALDKQSEKASNYHDEDIESVLKN